MSGQLCVVLINLLQHLTQSMSNPYYIPVKTIGTPPDVDRWNVSNLQPDTRYLVQVAAVTSKGDGKRSDKVRVDTPGGVPSMPRIEVKLIEREPAITIDIEWTRWDHKVNAFS